MTRAFISIDIPKEIKKEIKKIQEGLPEFVGKKTESQNLHLTLKFLGEVDKQKVEGVRKSLKEIRFNEFKIEIDSIGVFSEKFVRIVWLHLTNCEELQKIIDEKLKKLFELERKFMNHLTIARVKSLKNKEYFLEELKKIEINKIKFVVDKFRLKESVLRPEGPVYETIEEYILKKKI